VRLDMTFYASISLFVGPALFVAGFRDLKLRRMIENTPTARIRSMAMGLVEIQGTVLERSAVRTPFTDRDCAYWEVDISVRSRSNWTVLHRKNSGQPFYVEDGTGVALVYPEGSQCRVPAGSMEECRGFNLPDFYERYMTEQNLWQRHLWRLSTIRFRERTLDEGQNVYILGSAEPRAASLDVTLPDLEWEHGDALPWAEPELHATGTDAARPSAPRIPPRGPGRVRALHRYVSAVIRRGSNDPTFLISADSQTALATSLASSTLTKLIGGPALTVFGLGYWLLWSSAHHLPR
jgi:E3 Ubiquitin ligase